MCGSFCLKMGKRFTTHSSTRGIRKRRGHENQLLYGDTAFIEFSPQKRVTETQEVSENIYLDLDKNENPVAMTIEHALESADAQNLAFEIKSFEHQPRVNA